QAGEYAGTLVLDARRLAVHHALGAHHSTTICLADGLMSEADAEGGNRTSPAADRGDRDACLRRCAGPRRDDDGRRRQRADLVDRDGIVAPYHRLRPELTEVLDEVVGEGIVVVDDED